MSGGRAIDGDALVEGQRLGPGTVLFLTVAMLALVGDGFDLSAIGYVAPALTRAWGLPPQAMVPAFSAGIIGMMIGGPLLGWLGDRLGRRRLILAGLLAVALLTLATAAVSSLAQLAGLRLLTGVGLGGIIPNVGSLVAELSPTRTRGRRLVIVTLGVPLGIALPGLATAALMPRFGWQALMIVGGLLPLAIALLVAAMLPESIRYLAARGDEASVRRVARRLRPDLGIADDAPIGWRTAASRGPSGDIFAGDLGIVTPLLWVCQAANQMANFFALTWLPTLLQAGGGGAAVGATAALFALGGLASGLALLLVLDRTGVIPVLALFVAGTPLVAAMAIGDLPPVLHAGIIVGAGLCVTGVQIGITALLGLFYPTAIRSTGAGWTQAAGRVGALAAPIVGGLLLGLRVPMARLPLAPAALMAVGAVACAALAWRCIHRFGGIQPAEFLTARPDDVGYAAG